MDKASLLEQHTVWVCCFGIARLWRFESTQDRFCQLMYILVLVLAAWPAGFFLDLVTGPLVTGQRSSGDRPPIGAIGDAALYCTC